LAAPFTKRLGVTVWYPLGIPCVVFGIVASAVI
jgi:hypothetical protein